MKKNLKKLLVTSLLTGVFVTAGLSPVIFAEDQTESQQVEERKAYEDLFKFVKEKLYTVLVIKDDELQLVEDVKDYEIKLLNEFIQAIPNVLELADEADLVDLEETSQQAELAIAKFNEGVEETEQVELTEVIYTDDKEENILVYLEHLLDKLFVEDEVKLVDDLDEDEAKLSLEYAKVLLKEVELADSDRLNVVNDKVKVLEENFQEEVSKLSIQEDTENFALDNKLTGFSNNIASSNNTRRNNSSKPTNNKRQVRNVFNKIVSLGNNPTTPTFSGQPSLSSQPQESVVRQVKSTNENIGKRNPSVSSNQSNLLSKVVNPSANSNTKTTSSNSSVSSSNQGVTYVNSPGLGPVQIGATRPSKSQPKISYRDGKTVYTSTSDNAELIIGDDGSVELKYLNKPEGHSYYKTEYGTHGYWMEEVAFSGLSDEHRTLIRSQEMKVTAEQLSPGEIAEGYKKQVERDGYENYDRYHYVEKDSPERIRSRENPEVPEQPILTEEEIQQAKQEAYEAYEAQEQEEQEGQE